MNCSNLFIQLTLRILNEYKQALIQPKTKLAHERLVHLQLYLLFIYVDWMIMVVGAMLFTERLDLGQSK